MLASRASYPIVVNAQWPSKLKGSNQRVVTRCVNSWLNPQCSRYGTQNLFPNKSTPLLRRPSDTCTSLSRAVATTTAAATAISRSAPIAPMTTPQTLTPYKKHKGKKIIFAGKLMAKQPKSNNSAAEQMGRNVKRRDLLQQMTRKWRSGDIYSPHDLTGFAMSKFRRKRARPPMDVLDLLGIDPLKEYKNFALMSDFTTETGRIIHSDRTGLRGRNQRRMAKTIRRAVGIGILPSVNKHPELSNVRTWWRSRSRAKR